MTSQVVQELYCMQDGQSCLIEAQEAGGGRGEKLDGLNPETTNPALRTGCLCPKSAFALKTRCISADARHCPGGRGNEYLRGLSIEPFKQRLECPTVKRRRQGAWFSREPAASKVVQLCASRAGQDLKMRPHIPSFRVLCRESLLHNVP